jgi:hypothetical protein
MSHVESGGGGNGGLIEILETTAAFDPLGIFIELFAFGLLAMFDVSIV